MIESPPWIKPLRPQSDKAFFHKQGVGEGEKRIDRIFRRATIAGREIKVWQLTRFQHMRKR